MKLHLDKLNASPIGEYPYNCRIVILDYEQVELNQIHEWLNEHDVDYIPTSNRIWLREENVAWFMMRWS